MLSSIKQIVDIVKFYAFVGRGEAAVVEEEEVRVEGVHADLGLPGRRRRRRRVSFGFVKKKKGEREKKRAQGLVTE